jgi:TonB-linked SusC/RagA family outer membrane protein
MKKTVLLWVLGLLLTTQVFAQNRTISGTVKDSANNGEPLIGVNVTGKGTTIGTVTDIDGKYTLELPRDVNTIVFSYIGFNTVEKPILALTVNAVMSAQGQQLEDVTVTALAVKREARSTSFASQTISNEDFNKTGHDVFSALQGKTAGVRINATSGQVGTSNRIVIRGESSITGGNNALLVVDGIPIDNSSRVNNDNSFSNHTDFGNRGNDINPDDIESMTILSGPAATALYGSRGASGVVLITTKSGKSKDKDKLKVAVNSSVQFDKAYILLGRQNKWGEGYYPVGIVPGENFSWGPEVDGRPRIWTAPTTLPDGSTAQLIRPYSAVPNQLESFFNTGVTLINGFSFQGTSDKVNYYVSYGNFNNTGILPGQTYKRNNVTFNATANIHKMFSTTFGVKYSNVNTDQKVAGEEFANPYQAAIQTPINIPLQEVRDYNSPFQNLEGYYGSYEPNPYFILAKTKNISKTNNVLANVELNFKPTDYLTFTARIGDNIVNQDIEIKNPKYEYTLDRYNPDNFGGPRTFSLGQYSLDNWINNDLTVDVFGNFNKDLGKKKNFTLTVLGGFSYYDTYERELISQTVGGLVIPDFYDLSNSVENPATDQFSQRERLLGVFGNVNVSYKRFIFLEYSARNDWSSTLPLGANKFFYQAGGVSFVPTELMKGNSSKFLNYLKLRANAGTVGKGATPYKTASVFVSNPTFSDYPASTDYDVKFPRESINGTPVSGYTKGNNIGSPDLKPELTFTWEVGTDVGLFDDRVRLMYTYYSKNSKDLLVDVTLPASSGYFTQTQNVGQVTNKGHELSVFVTPIRNLKGFNWDLRYTFTKNNNKVVKVSDDSKELAVGGATVAGTFAVEGMPFGTWKVFDWDKDSLGRLIVDATGKPNQAALQEYAGSIQPKYQMGWGTTLSWKGLSFDIQFDMRKGGVFYSSTQSLSEFNGTAITTAKNDRLPYIVPNSVQRTGDGGFVENTTPLVDPYPFFRDLPTKYQLVDMSYIKLREASLSYTIPRKAFGKSPISNITVGIYGRNLKFWLPVSNQFADPESNGNGGNSNDQGFEDAVTPPTRSYGFNVKLEF